MKILLRILFYAMLLSQFAMLVHAYDHAAHEEIEECSICLKQSHAKANLPGTHEIPCPVADTREPVTAIVEHTFRLDIKLPAGRSPPFPD